MVFDRFKSEVVRDSSNNKAIILYNITKNNSIWVIPLVEWNKLNEEINKELEQIKIWENEENGS